MSPAVSGTFANWNRGRVRTLRTSSLEGQVRFIPALKEKSSWNWKSCLSLLFILMLWINVLTAFPYSDQILSKNIRVPISILKSQVHAIWCNLQMSFMNCGGLDSQKLWTVNNNLNLVCWLASFVLYRKIMPNIVMYWNFSKRKKLCKKWLFSFGQNSFEGLTQWCFFSVYLMCLTACRRHKGE